MIAVIQIACALVILSTIVMTLILMWAWFLRGWNGNDQS
jgi:hypothetical protein